VTHKPLVVFAAAAFLAVELVPDPREARRRPALELNKIGNIVALERDSFSFPGDGEKNQGKRIGPFCCTGETATVRTTVGASIGYIYFFAFEDTINLGNGRSAARIIKLLVSGAANLSASNSSQINSMIVFSATDSKPGDVKTVEAGNLRFTATLDGAVLAPGADLRFDKEQIAIRVAVEVLKTSNADQADPKLVFTRPTVPANTLLGMD
jgi:hypothetical protein